MTTAELLTSLEYCERRGFWSKSWRRHRINPMELLHESVKAGLSESQRQDYGERAGEESMNLATYRGIELPKMGTNHYDSVLHHGCLADILVTAIRKPNDPPWQPTPKVNDFWDSSSFISPDGNYLRRILCVSHWSQDRLRSELRSWFTIGECSMYGRPMQMVVAVVGQMVNGFRNSHWTKGLLHPTNHTLRFQPKMHQPHRKGQYSHGPTQKFNERWMPVRREEHAEISREKWLQQMLSDDCLRDLLFVVDVKCPDNPETIKDLAKRKLEILNSFYDLPDKQMSLCENLITPCPFRVCCWSDPETNPERGGFDDIT